MEEQYQTVTLVLDDGRRVTYTGKLQIDPVDPPKVVEIIVSKGHPLPTDMAWTTMPTSCQN